MKMVPIPPRGSWLSAPAPANSGCIIYRGYPMLPPWLVSCLSGVLLLIGGGAPGMGEPFSPQSKTELLLPAANEGRATKPAAKITDRIVQIIS